MNPPPNPHAEAARAAMREAIRPLLVNPPPAMPHPLYPLDNPLPLWHHECHSDGAALWVDDPAELFSGVEAAERMQEK